MTEGRYAMPTQEEFDEIKGRVVALEDQLKGRAEQSDIPSITPEEMQTFIKVRGVMSGGWGIAPVRSFAGRSCICTVCCCM